MRSPKDATVTWAAGQASHAALPAGAEKNWNAQETLRDLARPWRSHVLAHARRGRRWESPRRQARGRQLQKERTGRFQAAAANALPQVRPKKRLQIEQCGQDVSITSIRATGSGNTCIRPTRSGKSTARQNRHDWGLSVGRLPDLCCVCVLLVVP